MTPGPRARSRCRTIRIVEIRPAKPARMLTHRNHRRGGKFGKANPYSISAVFPATKLTPAPIKWFVAFSFSGYNPTRSTPTPAATNRMTASVPSHPLRRARRVSRGPMPIVRHPTAVHRPIMRVLSPCLRQNQPARQRSRLLLGAPRTGHFGRPPRELFAEPFFGSAERSGGQLVQIALAPGGAE